VQILPVLKQYCTIAPTWLASVYVLAT